MAATSPFTDVVVAEWVSTYRVLEAFDYHAAREEITTLRRPPRVVALDESAFPQAPPLQHDFLRPRAGVTFDLACGRTMGSALEGLLRMDDATRAAIETVVMDYHWPYRRAVEALLRHVRIVADKFHVIRVIDSAAQGVRVRNARRRRPRRRDGGARANTTVQPGAVGHPLDLHESPQAHNKGRREAPDGLRASP